MRRLLGRGCFWSGGAHGSRALTPGGLCIWRRVVRGCRCLERLHWSRLFQCCDDQCRQASAPPPCRAFSCQLVLTLSGFCVDPSAQQILSCTPFLSRTVFIVVMLAGLGVLLCTDTGLTNSFYIPYCFRVDAAWFRRYELHASSGGCGCCGLRVAGLWVPTTTLHRGRSGHFALSRQFDGICGMARSFFLLTMCVLQWKVW